jgi:hypothetical protein
MRHLGKRLWTRMSLVVCMLGGLGMGACALTPRASSPSIPGIITPTSSVTSTPHGVPVAPTALQTLHRDYVMWQWASGNCASATPPPAGAPSAGEALVGQQTWGSGGKGGYECQSTVRMYMAGLFFAPEQMGIQAPAHAVLQLHLESLTQPAGCLVEIGVAAPGWEVEDPSQGLDAPYATIPLGKGQSEPPSAHTVTIESRTQTVTIDVTSAAQDWAKQQSQPGLVLKTPYTCTLIHLSQVTLFLDHS